MESSIGCVIHPPNRYLLKGSDLLVSVLGTRDTAVNIIKISLTPWRLQSVYSAKVTQAPHLIYLISCFTQINFRSICLSFLIFKIGLLRR